MQALAVGHPKMAKLEEIVLEHFQKFQNSKIKLFISCVPLGRKFLKFDCGEFHKNVQYTCMFLNIFIGYVVINCRMVSKLGEMSESLIRREEN